MRNPGPDDVLYTFGPFVADPVIGTLRRNGLAVPLKPKSFDVLVALIERRGELVEKDRLLELVWPDSVVDENNLPRHISSLRKLLNDHPSDHPLIVTVQGRGYRFVAPVQEITRANLPSPAPSPPAPAAATVPPDIAGEATWAIERSRFATRRNLLALIVLAVAAVIVTGIVMFARIGHSAAASPERKLWQLTSSGDLESEPTWAPNGQAVAYASDRTGNLDIWTQPLGEGNPVQLTFSPAHDWQPSWSSDGRSIAFRSERDGGGLFVVPASGGPERRLTNFGYDPQWSPKGSQLLFFSTNVGRSKLYVVDADGQQLRRVLSDVLAGFISFRVAWHPDGRRISVYGTHAADGVSFWTAPVDGGDPVKSSLSTEVQKRLKATAVNLTRFQWARSGDALYFEGRSEEAVNIWRVKIDPATLEWREGPDRLTLGAGLDTNIAIAPDGRKLAFTTRSERTRLWSFPFDPNEGSPLGKGEPITASGADAVYPDVSRNGAQLVYRTTRRGRQELWAHPLDGGAERLLASSGELAAPVWSSDGATLAFRRQRSLDESGTRKETEIVLVSADGQHERLLTTPAQKTLTPYQWSGDNAWIVGACAQGPGRLFGVCLLPVSQAPHAQDQMRIIAKDPERNLYQAKFSPNQHWVAFNAVSADVGTSTIYVVAADGGQWMPVTEGTYWDDKPRWSPDGKMIYFLSNRSGFLNVWGRHFDPAAGKPSGDPFRVSAFENASERIYSPVNTMEMAIAPHQLILPIVEASAAVWVLENIDR